MTKRTVFMAETVVTGANTIGFYGNTTVFEANGTLFYRKRIPFMLNFLKVQNFWKVSFHSIVLFSIFYLLSSFSAFAQQNKIDSLENILKTAKEDTVKINTLNSLSRELTNTGDYPRALQYANDALQLFQSSKTLEMLFPKGKANTFTNIGNIYYYQSNYDKALENYFVSLKIREQSGEKQGMALSYNNIGNTYADKGNYDKALENLFASLKIYEEIGDKKKIAGSCNNIGTIYHEQGNYNKALDYYFTSLKIREELGDKKNIAASYNNIGSIYLEQKNHEKALESYFASLKIREELGDKKGIAASYNNIGDIYHQQGNYDKALKNHFFSLKIKEEIGDKNGMSASYINIGIVNTELKKFSDAEKWLKKGLLISREIGIKQGIKNAYANLSQLDSARGGWKGAYEYHQLYSEIKDSIFNEESSKQITEMSTKYETEKKEQQIKLLNKDKEIQAKDLQRQKTIRNAVAGGLILVLFFSFVLINRLLLIRKQKKVIEIEREKSEKLLLNILPKEIAEELKRLTPSPSPKERGAVPSPSVRVREGLAVTPKKYEMVTVMFTDFKGFTTIAEKMSAEELVSELDFIFKKFDEIISKYPIEKIKTIGDAYMCAGGLPSPNNTNPMDVTLAALEICEWMKVRGEKGEGRKEKFEIRIGVHTGSVIAGVVGDKKFAYDIWGDTVNTASRMESSGEAGKVNISGETYKALQNLSGFQNPKGLQFQFRGKISAKNKGEIEMYFVERK